MAMGKCVYCVRRATDMDALGLPACADHIHEADEYYQRRTGRDPNEDAFQYCKEHLDLWQPGCERCEACSQHHYGQGVAEALAGGDMYLEVAEFQTPEEAANFLNVVIAADHTYGCTCDHCREYWRRVGPDEEGFFGHFGKSID